LNQKELGIRLLPDKFVGKKTDLNRNANPSSFEFNLKDATLETTDETLATGACMSPTTLLPWDVRFSYFVHGILNGSIDLDKLPVFKHHMSQFEEERKVLHATLKTLGKLPSSAAPSRAARKPRETNGGDDDDDENGDDDDCDPEADGKPKAKSQDDDDEDLEDESSGMLLPNEKDFLALSRSCFSAKTKKRALPEMSMDERKEGLNWALENDLIQSVAFKNSEICQKYMSDDLEGSGCFIKLKKRTLEIHKIVLATAAANSYYTAKRKSEAAANSYFKKAKKSKQASSTTVTVCFRFDIFILTPGLKMNPFYFAHICCYTVSQHRWQ
jgi:hypothetical protein